MSRGVRSRKTLSEFNLFSSEVSSKPTPDEEAFFFACENGDLQTVERLIQDGSIKNVDRVDHLGRTPLRLAVSSEHLEIVEVLLQYCSTPSMYEALLQSISMGHENIAEVILKHPKYESISREVKSGKILQHDSFSRRRQSVFVSGMQNSSHFSSDVTPLILAAQNNRFGLVQLLLIKGETVEPPHHYECRCMECKIRFKDDQVKLAKARLSTYRALASEAYISLTSPDPILTAFDLGDELREIARVEKYFKIEYEALADNLSDYVVKLLEVVRTNDELMMVLNKTRGGFEKLARLELALDNEEKKFVAHPSCQQKLMNIWYDGSRRFEIASVPFKLAMIIGWLMLYPFLVLFYLFFPKSKVASIFRIPVVKFFSHTMSYIIFICLIVGCSLFLVEHTSGSLQKNFKTQYDLSKKYAPDFIKKIDWDLKIRSYQPHLGDILLMLWVLGFIVQECKEIYQSGFKKYSASAYNIIDFGMLTCYFAHYTLRVLISVQVYYSIKYFANETSWQVMHGEDTVERLYARQRFYWMRADRWFWNPWDPGYVADALFAIANVFTFSRISYLLPANEIFGPMHISLGRMIKDILVFFFIFSIFFGAFLLGMFNLFNYYDKHTRELVEPTHLVEKRGFPEGAKNFANPEMAFRTAFWAIFGMVEKDSTSMDGYGLMTPIIIQNVGYILFGGYVFAMTIVLLNMLIAMMSRSFDTIAEDSDTQWKFSRTKLYMDYIPDGSVLPSPFILLPEPQCVLHLLRSVYRRCTCQKKVIEEYDMQTIIIKNIFGFEIDQQDIWSRKPSGGGGADGPYSTEMNNGANGGEFNDEDLEFYCPAEINYLQVMHRIVRRFIFNQQSEDDSNNVDLDEIKQDISMFRYDVLNKLNENEIMMKRRSPADKGSVFSLFAPKSTPNPSPQPTEEGRRPSSAGGIIDTIFTKNQEGSGWKSMIGSLVGSREQLNDEADHLDTISTASYSTVSTNTSDDDNLDVAGHLSSLREVQPVTIVSREKKMNNLSNGVKMNGQAGGGGHRVAEKQVSFQEGEETMPEAKRKPSRRSRLYQRLIKNKKAKKAKGTSF